jgi:hypothetical protein
MSKALVAFADPRSNDNTRAKDPATREQGKSTIVQQLAPQALAGNHDRSDPICVAIQIEEAMATRFSTSDHDRRPVVDAPRFDSREGNFDCDVGARDQKARTFGRIHQTLCSS